MHGWRWNLCFASAVLALALVSAAGTGRAQTPAPVTTYLDGKTYQGLSDEARTNYVLGLFDMMQRLTSAVTEPKTRELLARYDRCASSMNARELREFVDGYLLADQTAAQYAMASNFIAALGLRCQ
jgi:hypothetical protein